MNNTFKCWLIANFEIALFVLTLIINTLIFAIFYRESTMLLWGAFIVFLSTIPLKNGGFSYSRYIIWLLILIFVAIGAFGGMDTPENPSRKVDAFGVVGFGVIWIIFIGASVVGGWLGIFAYRNIDEVVSLRMLYRNSSESLFESSWKYALDRFCNISLSIFLCIMWLFAMIAGAFGDL